MENANKALLISAGILLAIMILSLLVIFWGRLSGYYSSKHDAKIIEQDAKFNEQFDNYSGETIRGNELMSVMNRVVNYNTTIADLEKYDKVIMSVDFNGYQKGNNFIYSSTDASIFSGIIGRDNKLTNTEASDANLEKMTNLPSTLCSNSGISNMTDAKLQKLSAEIYNICDDNADVNTRNRKLQNILGYSESQVKNMSADTLSKIREVTKKYYQYTQLKRAMFKCTSVEHNTSSNGRVNKITFEIVVENGNVKFD